MAQMTSSEGFFLTRYSSLVKQKNEVLSNVNCISSEDTHLKQKLEIFNTILESIDRELGDLAQAMGNFRNSQ